MFKGPASGKYRNSAVKVSTTDVSAFKRVFALNNAHKQTILLSVKVQKKLASKTIPCRLITRVMGRYETGRPDTQKQEGAFANCCVWCFLVFAE